MDVLNISGIIEKVAWDLTDSVITQGTEVVIGHYIVDRCYPGTETLVGRVSPRCERVYGVLNYGIYFVLRNGYLVPFGGAYFSCYF